MTSAGVNVTLTSYLYSSAAVKSKVLALHCIYEQRLKSCMAYKIVYYAARGRKGTLLAIKFSVRVAGERARAAGECVVEAEVDTENTRNDKVPFPRGAYAIF